MDIDKREKIIKNVLAMNFIPMVIAVLMLFMILYFGFTSLNHLTLKSGGAFFMLLILPVLGFTTYQSAIINRKSSNKKWVWELGCVNSGIWTVIFLGIFIYQIVIIPFSSPIAFGSFIYFGYLFSLNKKMVEFEKSQELSQFEERK
jgi:hypothetical protein